MKKLFRAATLIVAAAAIAMLASCSLFGPSNTEIQTAFDAFGTGYASAFTGTTTYNSSYTVSTSVNSAGTVTVTVDMSNTSAITESIAFKSYNDSATGYTISGTVTAAVSLSSTNVQSLAETGTLTYAGGAVTSLGFNVTQVADSTTSTGYAYTGYVTANGIKKYTVQ